VTENALSDGRAGITAGLVRRLLAEQAPRWAELPIEPVPVDGWDNRTYRLGAELTVRLPTGVGYAAAVEKESRWLPTLAPHLPVPIPEPVFTGRPGAGYPFRWSVRRWLPGEPAAADRITDPARFAAEIGEFIVALQSLDATGGPSAGEHSFHRGQSPEWYDDETRRALATRADRLEAAGLDVAWASAVWDTALSTTWSGPPVWFHGDIAPGNLLVHDGSLTAVIDFGTSGVGDPACDLVLAWTFLSGEARQVFRHTVEQDEQTWARARGWTLWKALISLTDEPESASHLRVIQAVLTDPVGA
jgi:aminoglycoside phosphotransferase (APT) family kinase protein